MRPELNLKQQRNRMLSPPICRVDSYRLSHLLLSERSVAKPHFLFSEAPSGKLVALAMDQENSLGPSSLGELRAGTYLAAMQTPQVKCPGGGVLATQSGFQKGPRTPPPLRLRGPVSWSMTFSPSSRALFPGHGAPRVPE